MAQSSTATIPSTLAAPICPACLTPLLVIWGGKDFDQEHVQACGCGSPTPLKQMKLAEVRWNF